ncbi:RAD50-interacting protein 1 [Amphibalanus amphitrite]|uniref:RAD50-interacting protein 1 n=1 Tax=Amphibalanus amphitrite TaxID=1232801 RepID=A0A6A4V207_AMPAM|nr:RAD50-interacting protein 1 [Amphibalanus amphitrite]
MEDTMHLDKSSSMDTKFSSAMLKKANQLFGSKGDDIDHLETIREQLLARKDELERDLAISNKSSDSALSQLLTRAQSATAQIDSLQKTVEPLCAQCDTFVSANSELCAALAPPLAAEELRLKERSYRALLRRLTQLSDAVRERVSAGQLDEALARLRELHEATSGVVSESRCHALAEYCRGLVSAWRGLLLRRLTAQLDAALAELRYPFISTNMAVHAAPPGPEAQLHLETALARLAALAGCGEEPAPARPSVLAAFPPASLPVRLLLRPLVRRFVYHFQGQKRTNDPSRPEWYMGQVLQWITDHEQFLETSVEPTLAKTLPDCRPRLEFCRGLVELTVDKLLRDLPELQNDNASFSHTVDETLQLQRGLAQLGYGGGGGEQPGPLLAVCQPGYLLRWVTIERKYALERVDQMMASETAWAVQGEADGGVTEVRKGGGELADGVLNMLQAMTERYLLLPEPGQRLQFLELQLELLDDLRVRLLQLLGNEKQEPLGERCCALLNTAHHLRRALTEWGEQPVFLHLQFFRRRLTAAEASGRRAERRESEGEEEEEPTLSLDQLLLEPEPPQDPAGGGGPPDDADDGLNVTAFDEIVQRLGRIENDIVEAIVNQILLEVKARSRPYRKDKWFAMPSPTDFVSPSLTPTACPILQVLTQCLQQLRGLLAASVFDSVWHALASQLCEYLYDELVMANSFNEGGAAQLRFDIERNLLAVFSDLGDDPDGARRPTVAFRPLLSATVLLTLPTGSALLLLDTIKHSPETTDTALAEAGADGLTPAEAREVLLRRTALSVS